MGDALTTEKKLGLLRRAWEEFRKMSKFQKGMVLTPLTAFLLVLVLVISGCYATPNLDLVKVEQEELSQLQKVMDRYVLNNKDIPEVERKAYKGHLDSWARMLQEFRERAEGSKESD